MNFKLNTTILLAALLAICANAAVVRIDATDSKGSVEKADFIESPPETTPKTTVLTAVPKEITAKVDESTDATIDVATVATVLVEDAPRAVTRDADATIEIDKTLLDPAADTDTATEGVDLDVDLAVLEDTENKSGTELVKKSAALLLLNVPNHGKPKQLEENIEEPEELTAEGSTQETTTDSATDVTTTELADETTTPLISTKDTVSSDVAIKSDDKAAAVDAVQESSPVAPNDNAHETLLIADSGEDFVIFDGDIEQLGSFTHIDSDERLQPIVQSVEIVPTSVDDSLLVNYVHSW